MLSTSTPPPDRRVDKAPVGRAVQQEGLLASSLESYLLVRLFFLIAGNLIPEGAMLRTLILHTDKQKPVSLQFNPSSVKHKKHIYLHKKMGQWRDC